MTPWCEWEDYQAGLYASTSDPEHREAARQLLTDPDQFYEAAREMLRAWPVAAHHNLSNMWSGRNAWLGQAACCYSTGATAQSTREAWGEMSNDQQRAANATAVRVRDAWERERRDEQTLFGV